MIQVFGEITIAWVPDGAGPMEVPSAQRLTIKAQPQYGNTGPVVVAGGNTPTGAQVTAAIATLGTNIATVMTNATNLGVIDGWVTGTG